MLKEDLCGYQDECGLEMSGRFFLLFCFSYAILFVVTIFTLSHTAKEVTERGHGCGKQLRKK